MYPLIKAAGGEALLRCADLDIALSWPSADWPAVLAPRYGAFMFETEPESAPRQTSSAGPEPFRLQLEATGRRPTPARIQQLFREKVEAETSPSRLRLRSASTDVELDLDARRGRLRAPLHRHGVDLALRALLAAAPGGLLLHGGLLIDGDRAFLAAGASGVGKSTLARLLPRQARCDELTLLARQENTADWQALATPFWHGRPGRATLRAAFLLRHGAENRRRLLRPSEALRGLATQVIWPAGPEAKEAAFARLARLVEEVPVFELEFRPTPAVWATLSEGLPA